MSDIAIIAWALGSLAIGGGFLAVRVPEAVLGGLEKYPRSVWPGRILAAVDLVWAAYAMTLMHLGGFDAWKVHLIWLVPVCIVLAIVYLDEMLSVRALGGLLLLAAGLMLNAARWHPSAWRLVISVLAYIWIVFGLVWLLEPWWFRRMVLRMNSPKVIRAGGIVKIAIGIGLISLALLVY